LGTSNTWTQQQSFNARVLANGLLVSLGGFEFNPSIYTGTATLLSSDTVTFCDTTAGVFTASLPAAPVNGLAFYIKQINSANALTVSGNGHNIDGVASIAFTAQNEAIMVVYDGANTAWYVVAQVATTIL
jgi:hypothetical protein